MAPGSLLFTTRLLCSSLPARQLPPPSPSVFMTQAPVLLHTRLFHTPLHCLRSSDPLRFAILFCNSPPQTM
jgi:hypothetical protein